MSSTLMGSRSLLFLKRCATWYENSKRGDTVKSDSLAQVESQVLGEHGVGVDLPSGCINRQVSLWATAYEKESGEKLRVQSERSSADHGIPRTKKDRPPTPSAWELWSASHNNALRVIDALLSWHSLPRAHLPAACTGSHAPSLDSYCSTVRWLLPGDHVVESTVPEHLFRLYLSLLGLYVLGKAESWLKVKLAILDAHAKHQTEMPAVKTPFRSRSLLSKRLWSGESGTDWARWLLRSPECTQGFVFWMKRAAPKASDEQIKIEENASFDILTTPHLTADIEISVPVDDFPVSVPISFEQLKLQVIRTAREVFGGGKTIDGKSFRPLKVRDKLPFQLPSASAHFESTRSAGGARAEVCAVFTSSLEVLYNLQRVPALHLPGASPDVWTRADIIRHATDGPPAAMVPGPYLMDDGFLHYPRNPMLATLRHLGFRPPEEMIGLPTIWASHWVDSTLESYQVRDALRNTWHVAHVIPPPARVVALPEPLKIRTITAGPELAYYWALYIQKILHSHIKQHPAFRLIGKTLDAVDIHQTFRTFLPDNHFFVSGDYQAATNLISSELTEVAAHTFCDMLGLDEEMTGLVINCLINHELHVTGLDGKSRQGRQQNGQLMGSPLSFPFLCLINAALTRFSLELRHPLRPLLSLSTMELLINGDDVAFVTDKVGYEIWKKVTRLGGLVASIGKNFTSPDFLVINSMMFSLHERMEVATGMRPDSRNRRYFAPHPACGECGQIHDTPHTVVRPPREWQGNIVDEQELMGHVGRPLTQEDKHRAGRKMRNVFSTVHWFNPDYLGPAGFFIDRTPKEVKLHDPTSLKLLQNLVKKSRFSSPITQLSQLFDPSGYSILPGLQQKWLGNVRGKPRHLANLKFLSSWKSVMDLAVTDIGGHKFISDWFLPTALGGMGLENTSGKGVLSSSDNNRRLASFLARFPQQRPIAMPVLRMPNPLGLDATDRISRLPTETKVYLTASQVRRGVSQDLVSHDAMLGIANRSSLLHFAGMGCDVADLNGSYSRLGWTPHLEASIRLEQYRQGRRKLFETSNRKKWSKYSPITQRQLDVFEPEVLHYRIGTHVIPRVDFSSDPANVGIPSRVGARDPLVRYGQHSALVQPLALDEEIQDMMFWYGNDINLGAHVGDLGRLEWE